MYTWNQTDHGQLKKTVSPYQSIVSYFYNGADKSSEEKVKIETTCNRNRTLSLMDYVHGNLTHAIGVLDFFITEDFTT